MIQFKWKGILFEVGFWFVFSITYLLCIQKSTIFQYAVLFSILHECGHLFCYFLFKKPPQKITFSLFGMTIIPDTNIKYSYREECLLAFFGPLVNLLCMLFFSLLYVFKKSLNALTIAFVNFWIFTFNMLPIFALDGGRILQYALLEHIENERVVFNTLQISSFFFILLIFLFGFFIFLRSKYNYSLLFLSLYFILHLYKKSR